MYRVVAGLELDLAELGDKHVLMQPTPGGGLTSATARLATLYGARPGTLSLLKLARMVVTHIVLTGGIALGDDVIHQVIGHGLTAKLSARLGEGLFNGALTTRIGIAAIDVCRPLPYLESQRPRFREMVAEVAGIR
jgi:putative membrane protein